MTASNYVWYFITGDFDLLSYEAFEGNNVTLAITEQTKGKPSLDTFTLNWDGITSRPLTPQSSEAEVCCVNFQAESYLNISLLQKHILRSGNTSPTWHGGLEPTHSKQRSGRYHSDRGNEWGALRSVPRGSGYLYMGHLLIRNICLWVTAFSTTACTMSVS